MNLESKIVVEGCPKVKFRAVTEPVMFNFGVDGGLKIDVDEMVASLDAFRICMRIPFLPGGEVVVGSIGPFGVRLQPVAASVTAFGVRLEGKLGTEGINCDVEGQVACKVDIDIDANIPAGMAKSALKELLED